MKALIALSGGVDSSVTAKLMQEEGFDCVGCTMKLFEPDRIIKPRERVSDNERDAGAIAEKLGIEYHVFDYREQFFRCVMKPFAEGYARGVTPNPCIDCNLHLKFGLLLREADRLGCDCIATGHYARIERDSQGTYLLKRGIDESKDQSYVLYNLTQGQLARVRFPLGNMRKSEVRRIAEKNGFINADRPDSQDICFVPEGRYTDAVEKIAGRDFPPGDFMDLSGEKMGTHKGIIYYTIGQHKRLGQAFGRPRYVCRIDGEHNRIYLGGPDDVYSSYAKAGRFNWIGGRLPEGRLRCGVKTRYKQKEQAATVRPVSFGTYGNEEPAEQGAEIFFDEPQRAITPGQSAVLYDGDTVLGGGIILPQAVGDENTVRSAEDTIR